MEGKTLLIVAVVLEIGRSTSSPSNVEFCIHPNIPDFYFNATFGADDVMEVTDSFTLHSVSPQCNSNNVTAIQYCYRADSPNANSNDRKDVFQFLLMSEDGFNIFTVQSALKGIPCRSRQNKPFDCCDTYKVPLEEQFQIPSNFSVYTTNPDRKLLMISVSEGSANLPDWGQLNMPSILLLRFMTCEY